MKEYLDKLEREYADQHGMIFERFTGQSLTPHVQKIKNLIDKHNCSTILDYGCGNALEYLHKKTHELVWNVSAVLYDPNHPQYNKLPDDEFDGVVCTDVMEHIPEPCVASVLDKIFSRSKKFVFFNISVRKAAKTLPNGENAHITVKPTEWWGNMIKKSNTKGIEVIVEYDK
tara:strand:- start:269 stop:784 length:516 start_codon:yes stop_codon:yes gene_type:complete